MRPQTTATRFAVLVGVVILVGVAGFFTQQYQLNRLAEKELEKAELAWEERDFAKAVTLFRDHLRVFPEHEEIKIKYADALLKASQRRLIKMRRLEFMPGFSASGGCHRWTASHRRR